jgi:hypothetical protein
MTVLRGTHTNDLSDQAIWTFAEQARPQLAKFVNPSPQAVAEFRNRFKPAIVIARLPEGDVSLSPTPRVAGERWWNANADRVKSLLAYVDYFEPPVNEKHEKDCARYAEATARFVELAARDGARCVVGNFARGTPEIDQFIQFTPALAAAKAHNGALGLHEYFHKHDLGLGYQTGRVKDFFYNNIPEQYRIPVFITEFGLDNGDIGRWRPTAGWRDAGYKDAIDYMVDLDNACVWYSLMCPYVKGVCLFNIGDYANQSWKSFNANDPLLAQWIANGPKYQAEQPKPEEPVPGFNTNPNGKSIYEPGAMNRLATKMQYIFVSDEVTGEGRTGGNVVQATLKDPKTGKLYLAVWSPGFAEAGLLGPLA